MRRKPQRVTLPSAANVRDALEDNGIEFTRVEADGVEGFHVPGDTLSGYTLWPDSEGRYYLPPSIALRIR